MSTGGSTLLERHVELEALSAAVAGAKQGRGRVLIVEGPAGIGKTRLVEAGRGLAEANGVRVLGASAHELEREFPYGVCKQLYEPALATADNAEKERWLSGAARIVPAIAAEPGDVGPARAEGTFARLHGLYWLFANIASEGPVLLLVDDAQWADDPSLRFLGFLARRAGELRLSLVVATRRAQPGSRSLLLDLISDPAASKLRPAPLSRDAVALWIAADLGTSADSVFAEACREATSGYPFFVRELLHEIRTERLPLRAEAAARVRELGPEGVASVVLVRLARLPAAAGALAQAVAVLGDGADLRTGARLAMLDEDDAGAAIDSLSAADVLLPGETVRFVHPIIRAAILADLPPAKRADLRSKAARLLHERGAPIERVAAHLLAAERIDEPWTLEVLREAGGDAMARGGSETAARYLERAVAMAPPSERPPLLLELGKAEALAGDPRGIEHLRQAIRIAPDPLTAARIGLTLGRTLKFAGQPLQACDVLERASADARTDPELHDLLETELLTLAYVSVDARDRLRSRLAALRDPSSGSGSPRDAVVLAALAVEAVHAREPVDRVVSLARRALAASAPSAGPYENYATVVISTVLSVCDRFGEAETTFARLLEEARRQGWLVGYLAVVGRRSMMQYRRGALREAEADATEALTGASGLDNPKAVAVWAQSARIFVALERGDKNELDALVQRLDAGSVSDAPQAAGALPSHGLLRAATGDTRGALDDLMAAREQELRWRTANPTVSSWRSDAALILMGLGEHEQAEARRLAQEELELARAFGARRALGIALRAVALTSRPAADLATLEEAVDVLSTSGAELEHARALVELGGAIRRAGPPAGARDSLRRGYELAIRCGARALADRAMQELLAAGARPRRTALSGVESLTPSELRVAELAADGLTNREIAQALFVTEKTVETHLGRVYPKLDITSRAELPAKLDRFDRDEPAELFRARA
jgi:DNA-binding CsgD family transcriptional regulator